MKNSDVKIGKIIHIENSCSPRVIGAIDTIIKKHNADVNKGRNCFSMFLIETIPRLIIGRITIAKNCVCISPNSIMIIAEMPETAPTMNKVFLFNFGLNENIRPAKIIIAPINGIGGMGEILSIVEEKLKILSGV